MRKILIGSLAFALLPAAVPARAGTASPNAAGASPPTSQQAPAREAAPDPNRQVCVTERLSGSRMPRRVCRTAREWELLQNDGSEDR
ncbi:MAG: hypothetical protein E6G92_11295 [Alphaproteobacteria bacterium]|nr:MAG: hypothetical protein E6G92_11295 [Alphaproteobacteria bacterium]